MKIMLLNDGETWTDLANCQIIEAPEDAGPDDESFLDDATVLYTFRGDEDDAMRYEDRINLTPGAIREMGYVGTDEDCRAVADAILDSDAVWEAIHTIVEAMG